MFCLIPYRDGFILIGMNRWLQIILMAFTLLAQSSGYLYAQDLKEVESVACQNQGPECSQNAVTESDLKNPHDNGTMKLVSAGASLLYMGGVLNGVVAMPAFMGDVANICIGSGLNVGANLLAFMNARGNGKKIKTELSTIQKEAQELKDQLENEELRRSKEFQIMVFDFYMRALERLRKITELRIKQHGKNSTYYSIAMAAGLAEAIIYSLPWSSNPPMAKCGAKAAVFAGIALALEKKGQNQANKLLDAYNKRWGILAQIKARLEMGTISTAKIDGDIEAPDRTSLGGDLAPTTNSLIGPNADQDGLVVTDEEYGCVNTKSEMDQSCGCVKTNTCYQTQTQSWKNARYGSAFSDVGLNDHIKNMNSAFRGKNSSSSSWSMASINEGNAKAARLRDNLLKDYAEKEKTSSKKYRLGRSIGIATDKELANFLNANFKKSQIDEMFKRFPEAFVGPNDIDLGNVDENLLAKEADFSKSVAAITGSSKINSEVKEQSEVGDVDKFKFEFDAKKDENAIIGFNPKNIVIPENVEYDYVGKRDDVVRNDKASLFDIISHRYQLIYRKKTPEL